jgi:hypothetical protein
MSSQDARLFLGLAWAAAMGMLLVTGWWWVSLVALAMATLNLGLWWKDKP